MTFDRHNTVAASGLDQPEGPVVLSDGRWLVVEMGPSGAVVSIEPGGDLVRRLHTGRPNGLALLGSDLLIAESLQRNVLRVGLEPLLSHRVGDDDVTPVTVVASHDELGRAMRFPNDLCVGPDGAVYVTDSGVTLATLRAGVKLTNDMDRGLFDGRIYRIEPDSGKVDTLDDGLGHLNGLSFGPDGDLYVNDTLSGDVVRYALTDQPGKVLHKGAFANVIDRSVTPPDDPISVVGPDGQAHDTNGNLYVAVVNQGEVVVLDDHGRWIERLATDGRQPTNVAFGLQEAAVYITECDTGSLQRIPVAASGLLAPPRV